MADGTSTEHDSTVADAVPAFQRLLFPEDEAPASTDEGNTPETREAPPVAETAPEPDDADASPEQADAEGDTDDTDHDAADATDDTDTETAPDELDLTRMVTVKIDGKDEQVPLEEALKGYSRTAVFTRKAQALAEQRKAFEAEVEGVRAERQKYAVLLSQLEQQALQAMGQEPDWTTLQQQMTPEKFAAAYAQHQIDREATQRIVAERQRAMQVVQDDQRRQMEALVASEYQRLLEALPSWKDSAVADAERAQLAAYATKEYGWTTDDLERVVDHRNIVLLRKAMLYDAAQAKRPAVKAKIEKVKTATPGPASAPKAKVSPAQQARQRLAKTGDVKDFAAAFEAMMDD